MGLFRWLMRRVGFGGGGEPAAAAPASLQELKRRLRVVVIDDDPSAFPTSMFAAEGYNITHWMKVESLDRLERGEFDIIVLDIGGVAPHLSSLVPQDGLSVLANIKASNPGQVIVAFSGQSFAPSKQHFFSAADDVLDKPADFMRCKEVLDHMMTTRFTRQELLKGLELTLRKAGTPDAVVARIVKEFDSGEARHERLDPREFLKRFLDNADVIERAASWIARLAAVASGIGA